MTTSHALAVAAVAAPPAALAAVVDVSATTLVTAAACAGVALIQWLASRQIATVETTLRDHTAALATQGERLTRLEERHRALDARTRP